MILKVIYALFIGILLVLFVGVGIQTFYPEPKYPTYPTVLEKPRPDDGRPSKEQAKAEADFQKRVKAHEKKSVVYNRNAFIIALVFALVYMVISLVFAERLLVIADGLLLGGVFTLGYAVIRGFMADDKFRFIAVTVGLVVALVLGYLKFIRPLENKEQTAAV